MKKFIAPLIEIAIIAILIYFTFPFLKTGIDASIAAIKQPKWYYFLFAGTWVLWKFWGPTVYHKEENGDHIPVQYLGGERLNQEEYKTINQAKMHAMRYSKGYGGDSEMIQEGEDSIGEFFIIKTTLKIAGQFLEFFLIPYPKDNQPDPGKNGKYND